MSNRNRQIIGAAPLTPRTIESLEPRMLLTVSIQDGLVRVTDTRPDDQLVLVAWDEGEWGIMFQARHLQPSVELGREYWKQIPLKDVKGIEVDLSGGADCLNIDRELLNGSLPIKIIGGASADVAIVDTDIVSARAEYITGRFSTAGYFTQSGNNLLAGGAVDDTAPPEENTNPTPAQERQARRARLRAKLPQPKVRATKASRLALPFLSRPADVAKSRAADEAGSVFDELFRRLS